MKHLLPEAAPGASPAPHSRSKPDIPTSMAETRGLDPPRGGCVSSLRYTIARSVRLGQDCPERPRSGLLVLQMFPTARGLTIIAKAMRTRLRPPTADFDASASWKTLRMSHGKFSKVPADFQRHPWTIPAAPLGGRSPRDVRACHYRGVPTRNQESWCEFTPNSDSPLFAVCLLAESLPSCPTRVPRGPSWFTPPSDTHLVECHFNYAESDMRITKKSISFDAELCP